MKRIAIVGTGNVGLHLSRSLSTTDTETYLVNSRDLDGITGTEDLILIAVTDSAIPSVSERLSATLKDFQGIVAHTAGSVDADVLKGYFENYGVFYPLQTFSKKIEIDNYREIPIFIEGNSENTIHVLKEVASLCFENVYELFSEAREKLHLASVFACNFVNAMYVMAADILQEEGIPFDVIRPLIRQSAEKALKNEPEACQTGPARRGDTDIIRKHTEKLENNESLKKIYSEISEFIKKRYEQD